MDKYYRATSHLGSVSGSGMPGSMTPSGRVAALYRLWQMVGRPYEFVDIGSHSGVMLLLARGIGAALAVGLEYNDGSALGHVFEAFQKKGEKYSVAASTVANNFDTAVGPRRDGQEMLKSLPSIQSVGSKLPIAVYAFCDGFPPQDRKHMFQLVASNHKVKAVMCSPGKARGDPYNSAERILTALNKEAKAARLPRFERDGEQVVSMQGSGAKKTVIFYRRCLHKDL